MNSGEAYSIYNQLILVQNQISGYISDLKGSENILNGESYGEVASSATYAIELRVSTLNLIINDLVLASTKMLAYAKKLEAEERYRRELARKREIEERYRRELARKRLLNSSDDSKETV